MHMNYLLCATSTQKDIYVSMLCHHVSTFEYVLSHLIVTNVSLMLELEFNLPITMSNSNLTTSMHTHSSICSRKINSCLLISLIYILVY